MRLIPYTAITFRQEAAYNGFLAVKEGRIVDPTFYYLDEPYKPVRLSEEKRSWQTKPSTLHRCE